jgi:hypothetical protein
MMIIFTNPKFPLGQIVITSNAMQTLNCDEVNEGIRRHSIGDWGTICPEDKAMNDEGLQTGDRLMSAYGSGDRIFWIITEADRSVTTILLPEDY